jgi:3-phytase
MGLCMYASGSGLQVIVNGTDGRFQQWQLSEAPGDQSSDPVLFRAERVREFTVSSQPEGCVVDDENNRLFYGIEEQGIYAVAADHGEPANPVPIMEIDGITLVSDVEGMSLYKNRWAAVTWWCPVRAISVFSVFDRLPPFRYRGSFRSR